MRVFAYDGFDDNGHWISAQLTEKQIREENWDTWKIKMEKLQRLELISWENCLHDWMVENWAWEVK